MKESRNTPKALPPDPDNMNDARAGWADACIELMSELTGCERGQEALGDLVCNLFHWGDRNGITPDELESIFASRRKLYNEETAPFEKEY
jgi:hypothetical protein